MSLEGNGGPSGGVPHYLQRSAQASLCSIGSGQSEGSDPLNWESWELRPHDRSRWAMHGWVVAVDFLWCACPTGGRYGRIPDDPVQRFKGAKRKTAPVRSEKRGEGVYKG